MCPAVTKLKTGLFEYIHLNKAYVSTTRFLHLCKRNIEGGCILLRQLLNQELLSHFLSDAEDIILVTKNAPRLFF